MVALHLGQCARALCTFLCIRTVTHKMTTIRFGFPNEEAEMKVATYFLEDHTTGIWTDFFEGQVQPWRSISLAKHSVVPPLCVLGLIRLSWSCAYWWMVMETFFQSPHHYFLYIWSASVVESKSKILKVFPHSFLLASKLGIANNSATLSHFWKSFRNH